MKPMVHGGGMFGRATAPALAFVASDRSLMVSILLLVLPLHFFSAFLMISIVSQV